MDLTTLNSPQQHLPVYWERFVLKTPPALPVAVVSEDDNEDDDDDDDNDILLAEMMWVQCVCTYSIVYKGQRENLSRGVP